MIPKFENATCLLLIDVQIGVNDLEHWGGPTGRRNNPDAEANMLALLAEFRDRGLQVAFTRHDSREATSPLKLSLPTGELIDCYLVEDGCATTNRVGPDGTDYDPELVHSLSVANMHGEFCTAISTRDALSLCTGDVEHLSRNQGNE